MRIYIRVAYDGSGYHGWQFQEGVPTLEGQIRKALCALYGNEPEIIGASRTDAGVHAYGNVAVFDQGDMIPPERVCHALNTKLPEDIRIMESKQVDSLFNPRFDAHEKTYEYHILNTPIPIPTKRLYSHHHRYPLDVEAMKACGAMIEGEHNFTSFAAAAAQVKSFVRTVYECTAYSHGDEIIIRVRGNGFLYNMVRIISGTMLLAGSGRLKPPDIKDILKGRDRSLAGPTLPACGLFLKEIRY